MKRLVTLLLTAGMLLGAASGASAIDFKAKGQWIFGFGGLDASFFETRGQGSGGDTFAAMQRVRLQLEAIASESLSGTVMFEIGDTAWGNFGTGGALGADRPIIELRGAYIDWVVPSTEVKVRMGIQPIAFPSVAGGAAIIDDMTAGIVVSAPINDMFGVTAVWARPYNDNYAGFNQVTDTNGIYQNSGNYLDNIDIFALMLPVTGEGWKVTPWLSYMAVGRNAVYGTPTATGVVPPVGPAWQNNANGALNNYLVDGLLPRWANLANARGARAYADAFFVGLPMAFTFDAINVELDINYGSISGLGDMPGILPNETWSLDRRGWLIKGLFEYKMDWGTPGIFAWYGSGDDGNPENGSEVMPVINPAGNFTSFMGDGELGWSIWGNGLGYDNMLTYAGTWGFGLQIKNLSFMEDLSHIIRVAYWNGTSSPELLEDGVIAGMPGTGNSGSYMYMTTKDHLIEVNVDSTYQIYENLQAVLQLGYIANGFSGGNNRWSAIYDKKDAYKAALIFNYSF